MPATATVTVHPSQFPDQVRRDLLKSLRRRRVNHKFLYDSVRQTQQWLELHQAHSPSRTDPDCAAIYQRGFRAAAERVSAEGVHVIGLGCGGGRKDTRLLRQLKARGRELFYTPCDVSTAMVLTAWRAARAVVPEPRCRPLVCDLASATDLPAWFEHHSPPRATRLITFFGMMPNFEPDIILPKIAALIRRRDGLLLSANLAPGDDYARGMTKILPQYDNRLTRDWLLSFLLSVGLGARDGRLRFCVETRRGLMRVAAHFQFVRACRVQVEGRRFAYRAGQDLRLFYSYRYTPALLRGRLARHGFEIIGEWVTRSGEEGVFLCRKAAVARRRSRALSETS
jgi:L-histidine Nalpha-methyltransferase